MTLHLSSFWPPRPLSLLLVVALHPSDEAARAAWTEWERLDLVEDANWADLRIFPTVARRLAALGVVSPIVPRLAGVRRFMWSKMQNRIRVTRPYIAALVEAGVTPMLTKGAARIALNPDCGFAPNSAEPPSLDEAYEKLKRLAEAATRVRRRFAK